MPQLKNIFFCFSILIISMAISSCEDDLKDCKADPECEYFRCKVNGEEWRPDCESDFLGCTHTDVQYYKEAGYLIFISKNSNDKEEFVLYVRNLNSINQEFKFFVGENTKSTFSLQKQNAKSTYIVDTTSVNYIILNTLDTTNYLIEGTFLFNVKNDKGEIIKITDGEFRHRYRF